MEDLPGCDHVGRVDSGVIGEVCIPGERTEPGGSPTLVDQRHEFGFVSGTRQSWQCGTTRHRYDNTQSENCPHSVTHSEVFDQILTNLSVTMTSGDVSLMAPVPASDAARSQQPGVRRTTDQARTPDRGPSTSVVALYARPMTHNSCVLDPVGGLSRLPFMRPATAIVVIVLLLVIAGAAIYQTIELLNPPESVPSQLPD